MLLHIEAVNFSPLSTSLLIAITSDVTVIYTAERVFSFVSDNLCNLCFSLVSDDKSVRSLWFLHKRQRLCAGLTKLRKLTTFYVLVLASYLEIDLTADCMSRKIRRLIGTAEFQSLYGWLVISHTFFSLQNGQKNKYPSICPRIVLICFNESSRKCNLKYSTEAQFLHLTLVHNEWHSFL